MKSSVSAYILSIIFVILSALPGYAAGTLSVLVSIAPQKYFVQQIGKDRVDVQVMVPPGGSPATYEPKPRQMTALSKAKLYFAIGVPFEKRWLRKFAATNLKMKIIYTDAGIEKIPMATQDHLHPDSPQSNSGDDQHVKDDYSSPDPHIWLSPSLVKKQAGAILAALQENDPAHRTVYQANYRQFISRIDALDTRLRLTFKDLPGRRFMVFHPSWGYFANDYGLRQVPIEIEGKTPKPAQLTALIKHAREKGITVIFVQPQFSAKSAELIATEIGGQVVFADPLAEDWLTNLSEVAAKFEAALK